MCEQEGNYRSSYVLGELNQGLRFGILSTSTENWVPNANSPQILVCSRYVLITRLIEGAIVPYADSSCSDCNSPVQTCLSNQPVVISVFLTSAKFS